ncbi:hypothetical protein [Psychrobacter immobilis]|uniref:hypothetical protein n=1 Tax=Psychrobacter immobilis TaxID=498 RepID=UPI0019182CB6|nr:hypothetical protein [Psychrobacter immobilis]
MSDNNRKTDLEPHNGADNGNEPHKRGLLISFIIFMAWVIGIGLALALIACKPVQLQGVTYEQR